VSVMRGFLGALTLSLLLLLVLVPRGAASQGTGAVVGLVTDSSGQPLADVLVFVDDGATATLTDQLGLFGLLDLSLSRHVLGYRKAGYAPRSFGLDLSTGVDYRDLGAVVLMPGPEPTATIGGRVTDGVDGPGLQGATVELNGRAVAVTDSTGAFAAAPTPVMWGSNDLTIRHRAFSDRSVSDRIWVSNAGEAFDFVVALDVVPVALPELAVPVQSRVLAAEGFYQRREDLGGAGIFITREEITARRPRRMEELFRTVLNGAGMNRAPSSFGRSDGGRSCRPIFFLNGLRMGEVDAPSGSSSGLDQIVHPEEVEGIEIYETISGLPAKYSPVGSVCGVILIWTS
jgi:hypothetical protein